MNYLLAGIAVILILLGVEQWGEHRVQVEWDKETAARIAITGQAKRQSAEAANDVEEQHKKDIEYAKSQAGRAAVADFLRRHGLLPDGSPVSVARGDGQAEVPVRTDGAACESGFAERIKEFAARCLHDARKVEMCMEWAKRENLEVVE